MNNPIARRITLFARICLVVMTLEVLSPLSSLALTSGPSQPEVQSFEPAGTSQMVDLFSGDFNYNIPLLDVGGYPINLTYHAGISMDQEASWVGLGWNINPGALTRQKRGLPDDLNGETVERFVNIRNEKTFGGSAVTGLKSAELFGFEMIRGGLSFGMGISWNNYRGWSTKSIVNPRLIIAEANTKHTNNSGTDISLNFTSSSESGLDIGANLNVRNSYLNDKVKRPTYEQGNNFSVGARFNSRQGLQSIGLDYGHYNQKSSEHLSQNGGGEVAGMSFAQSTWTPTGDFSYSNASGTLSGKLGIEGLGAFANVEFTGYFMERWLKSSTLRKPAYGYLYEQNKSSSDVLLDFNREQEGILGKGSANLPIANHTYDLFSASGHGIAGAYRAKRSDIPALFDAKTKSTGGGGRHGSEWGAGFLMEAGVNLGWSYNKSTAGYWYDNNKLRTTANFVSQAQKPSDIDYEPAYFASMGELSVADTNFLDHFKRTELVRPYLYGETQLSPHLTTDDGQAFPIGSSNFIENSRDERQVRNTYMSYLCGNDAAIAGLDKKIYSYGLNEAPVNGSFHPTPIERTENSDNPIKNHHMSEITVTGVDGMRYVYGIPAYSVSEKSVTFNASGLTGAVAGQIEYTSGDASMNNQRGEDHFYESVRTPSYAHSYLLTGIVSSDYVDLTGNGISDDDIGTAVKINYTRTSDDYHWRVPYGENKCSYSEGLLTDATDDRGSFLYGEKELWFMHSVESKNHIAIFKIVPRFDGHGAEGFHGGISYTGDQRNYRLETITLYSKQEYLQDPQSAVPIKKVHFEYDYSLCDGVDNSSNQSGKLTLKKVYFTYGTSEKGVSTPYKFVYSSTNPDYSFKSTDAWGNYKPYNSTLPNDKFPFVEQNKNLQDGYTQAWQLTQINLPSGGTINIEYESDDYAFVQDKRAMQMFKIKGFGSSDISGIHNSTYLIKEDKIEHLDRVYFDLKEPITGSDAAKQLKEQYLEGIKELQFTVYTRLGVESGNPASDPYEYVKGYAEIDYEDTDGFGVTSSGTVGYFPIKLGRAYNGDKKYDYVNPMALSAWNFARLRANYLVTSGKAKTVEDDGSKEQKFLQMLPFQGDLVRLTKGIYRSLQQRAFGKFVDPNKSWIRLNSPDGSKLGGGHRVKRIALSDSWSTMNDRDANASTYEYGQEYEYTTQTEDGRTISSGVASYEPMMGRDENPFVQPRYLSIDKLWVPDDEYMMDNPIGESYFPGASVGYSKVTVKALSNPNVERTGTGKTVSEFYTAKDFPIIFKETDLKANIRAPKFKIMRSIKRKTHFAGTQGYVIELNDMHGKPKATWNYRQGEERAYSGTEYKYHADLSGAQNKLLSYVQTVNPLGEVKSRMMGVHVDFHNDFRQTKSESLDGSISNNTNGFPILIALAAIISIIPGAVKAKNDSYTAVSTKVITRKGLLSEVIVHQEGATISTRNELYDAVTGQVLVTSTQNEFKDRIYNSTIPAYYAYDDGMGLAYKSNNMYIRKVSFTDGKPTLPYGLQNDDYLLEGDEVLVYPYLEDKDGNTIYATDGHSKATYHAWLYKGQDGALNLIDAQGNAIYLTNDADMRIIRSARKNMPGAGIMAVQSMAKPVDGTNKLAFTDVLNVSAVDYSEDWNTHLNYYQFNKCQDVPTDYYYDIVGLFQEMDDDSTMFVRPCAYNYTYPEHNCSYMVDKSTHTKEMLMQLTEPCGYTELGLQPNPNSIISFEDVTIPPNNVDGWEVTYTVNFDMLYRKDHLGNYTKLNESPGAASCQIVGSTGQTFLNDTYYVLDKSTNTYQPITIKEVMSLTCSGYSCTHQTNNMNGVSSSILTDIKNHSHVVGGETYTAWQLIYDQAENRYKIGFDWDDPGFPEQHCDVWIDLDGYQVYNIKEFLAFDITSMNQMRVQTEVQLQDGSIDTLWLTVTSDCGSFLDCEVVCGNEFVEAPINPFRSGLKGNWRPSKTWAFMSERNQNSSGVRTRTDGTLTTFDPFWSYSAIDGKYTQSTHPNWVWSSEITEYSQFGQELENKNPLDQYSSAMYGYNHTLPTAVSSNSKYKQMYFDGFEEYGFVNMSPNLGPCPSYKLNITDQVIASSDFSFDDTEQHTGNYSIKLEPSTQLDVTVALSGVPDAGFGDEDYVRLTKQDDDIGIFKPEPGKYVLGAWVKEARDAFETSYDAIAITLEITDDQSNTRTITFDAEGKLIDRWQRVEGIFEILAGDVEMKLSIVGADVASWIDDFRLHPFDGNMKSYVYDYRSLRLMAELDENNYATFYEYNNEGALVRVKKETERGISTLQESRSHTVEGN